MIGRMSEQEAMIVLQNMLTVRDINNDAANHSGSGYWGLCNSGGFTIATADGAGVTVTQEGVSLSAHKLGRFAPSEGGKELSQEIPYREELRFANISSIKLGEPGLLSQSCARREGQSEVFVRETSVRWYALLIPTSQKEQFIAAMLRLKPDVNFVH